MKKIVIDKAGDYRQLKIKTFPDLTPDENEIVVETKAIGINYADIIVRWGLYESAKQMVGWPITPGFEFSGVVKAVGSKVTKFKIGDKVLGVSLFNSYATEVKVTEDYLYLLPHKMSFEEGAAFPAVFLTAYHALFQIVVVRPGMIALIHSAAGGVGSSLVQLCKIFGIHSIGVVGSSHKVDFVKELGCDFVIDKSKEVLWEKVKSFAPNGVDLAYDANGVETLKESYNHLAPCGKLFFYGAHSMFPKTGGKVNWAKLVKDYLRTPSFNPLNMSHLNRSLITFNLSFLFDKREIFSEAMENLLKWYDEGKLKVSAVKSYSFNDVASAHKELESGKSVGKIILIP